MRNGSTGRAASDAGEPVDLPVGQGDQEQGEICERGHGQQGPGEGGEEAAVAQPSTPRVGRVDVRPGLRWTISMSPLYTTVKYSWPATIRTLTADLGTR